MIFLRFLLLTLFFIGFSISGFSWTDTQLNNRRNINRDKPSNSKIVKKSTKYTNSFAKFLRSFFPKTNSYKCYQEKRKIGVMILMYKHALKNKKPYSKINFYIERDYPDLIRNYSSIIDEVNSYLAITSSNDNDLLHSEDLLSESIQYIESDWKLLLNYINSKCFKKHSIVYDVSTSKEYILEVKISLLNLYLDVLHKRFIFKLGQEGVNQDQQLSNLRKKINLVRADFYKTITTHRKLLSSN